MERLVTYAGAGATRWGRGPLAPQRRSELRAGGAVSSGPNSLRHPSRRRRARQPYWRPFSTDGRDSIPAPHRTSHSVPASGSSARIRTAMRPTSCPSSCTGASCPIRTLVPRGGRIREPDCPRVRRADLPDHLPVDPRVARTGACQDRADPVRVPRDDPTLLLGRPAGAADRAGGSIARTLRVARDARLPANVDSCASADFAVLELHHMAKPST